MKKQLIAIIFAFLIISMPLTYGQVTSGQPSEREEIPPAEDILINVAEIQPKIVPQQAFETDDYIGYPVYALLNGIQTNPFIDVSKIRQISFRVVNTNVPGVFVSTRPPPYGRYSLDNMGLLVIKLPKIKDERKIPKRVDINITANILYDIGSGFGVTEVGRSIKQITEQEFTQDKSRYSFWSGRGYVKADLIEENRATFSVYDGRLQKVRTITLLQGQESGEISLATGYFFPSIGEEALRRNLRDRFKLRLDSIDVPRDKVKLQVLVNNKLILQELKINERLYEGSSWKIRSILPTDVQDRIELLNEDTKEIVPLTGSRLYKVNCADYKTKELCELFVQCKFDDVKNECVQKTTEVDVAKQSDAIKGHSAIGEITQSDINRATSKYQSNLAVKSKFTQADYIISRLYVERITEPGADHVPKSQDPNSIHTEWGVDVGISEGTNFNPLFNGKVAPETTKCSLVTTINGYPNYKIKYAHVVHGLKEGDNIAVGYPIAKVASAQECNVGTGPHLHLGFLRNNDLISLEEFESETKLFASLLKGQPLTTTQVDAEAEKELINVIKKFNDLKSSSSSKDFKLVVDKFVSIIKKYPSTTYDKTARDFLYSSFTLKTYQDINVKKEIQDYIAEKFKEIGFKVEVKEETVIVRDSKSYYKKAIEDYKNVVNLKGQVEKDKALEAQRKIAELYDYYLNEAENAIGAYQELINNYDINELEKITYESRIEFLKNSANYATQPVDIYEDGNLIKVILNGVEKTDVKPIAFISLDDKDAKEFKEGDYLTVDDKKTTWKIERIEGNKVNLVSDNVDLFIKQNLRDQLFIDTVRNLDNVKVKLVKIDAKKEARITISPILKALTSVSNFQVHIPIERRLIKLSDEQIDSQVEFSRKTINTLNSIINRVQKIYEWLTYYCYTIGTYLFLKNYLFIGGGRHLARQQVMEEWRIYCASKSPNDQEKIGNCILDNAKEIGKDIDKMQDGVKRTDKAFELIRKFRIDKTKKCEDIKLGTLETEFKDLSRLDLSILKEYCNTAKLDEKNEVINEDAIRSKLLQREKATLSWEKSTGFQEIKDKNLAEFIEQDRNLRSEAKLEDLRKKEKSNFIDIKTGEIKDFDSLKPEVQEILKQSYGPEIVKNWDNKEYRLNAVNNYLDKKLNELSQLSFEEEKENDLKYYTENLDSVSRDKIENILLNKKQELGLYETSLVKPAKSPGPLNNVDKLNKEGEPRPRNILVTGNGDYYSNKDLIYVAIVEEKDKQERLTVLTLREYLEKNSEINKKFKDSNYDFKTLKESLGDKAYLTIKQQEDKYKVIEIKDAIITIPKPEFEITIESNKLKTITVDYYHYLEVERNSQGVITQASLWKKGYDGELTRLIDTFPISRCSEVVGKNVNKEAAKACSELERIDKVFIKNPEKTKSALFEDKYKLTGAALKSGVLECTNVMDPNDCLWLFSACDPVMCPVSRFTYQGFSVDNVVASGISGSIFLGLGLWRSPYLPFTGGEVGICVPGVLAGLKNIRSIMQGYEQCLLVKKEKGENVGICDTIFNVGMCRVAWREAYSFLNIKGGLLGAFFKWVSPSGAHGGQEYAFFYENIRKAGDFVDFFTNEYATTFVNAFRGGSTQEIGDQLCEAMIYGKLPGGGTFLEQLTRPEGPPQFIAIMDEVPHADIGLQSTSDYSVFYHIYAGESYPQVRYYVYLHDIDERISPSTLAIAPRFGLSGVTTGYLNRGDFVSDTVRLSDLPTGYDEVCVVINNVKKCGFGKVSSDFAVQYVQEQIIKDQFAKNITSERECIPDGSLISQFSGASALQISTAIGGLAFGSGLSNSGVIRKCSAIDPNLGTNENRWISRGTCGKDEQGRDLGTCWVDKNSLNLLREDVRNEILKNLEDTNKLKDKLKELDNLKGDSSFGLLSRIQNEIKKITGKDVDKEFLEKQKSIYNAAQQCGLDIKEDTDINIAIDMLDNALRTYLSSEIEDCEKILTSLYDLRNKIKEFREQSIDSLEREAKRLVDRYMGEIKTIDPEISQPVYFSIGEIHENIAHLLRAKETREIKLAVQKDETKKEEKPSQEFCVIEYEEDNGIFSSLTKRSNFYYRFINGKWQLQEPSYAPFITWTEISEQTCNNKFFESYDPIYKAICDNILKNINLNEKLNNEQKLANGIGYLAYIADRDYTPITPRSPIDIRSNDFLIVHTQIKDKERIEINPGDLHQFKTDNERYNLVVDACNGKYTGKLEVKKEEPKEEIKGNLPIKITLKLSSFGTFLGDWAESDEEYIFDGVGWKLPIGISKFGANYELGIKIIEQQILKYKDQKLEKIFLECGDKSYSFKYSDDVIKTINNGIENNCGYKDAGKVNLGGTTEKTEEKTPIKVDVDKPILPIDIRIVLYSTFGDNFLGNQMMGDLVYTWDGKKWIGEDIEKDIGSKSQDFNEGLIYINYKTLDENFKKHFARINFYCGKNAVIMATKDNLNSVNIIDKIKENAEKLCGYKYEAEKEEQKTNEIDQIIEKASQTFNVRSSIIKAMISRESSGRADVVGYSVKKCGEAGIMQLLSGIALAYGRNNDESIRITKIYKDVSYLGCNEIYGNDLFNFAQGKSLDELKKVDDRFDPVKNIFAGTNYLSSLLKKYNNNYNLALAAYNGGEPKIDNEIKKNPDCLTDFNKCNLDNKDYVDKILEEENKFLSETSITSNTIKLLFVPVFNSENNPSYNEYNNAIDTQYKIFINGIPNNCNAGNKFKITKLSFNEFNNIKKTFLCLLNPIEVIDLAKDYGFDINKYNILVGVGSESKPNIEGKCLPTETRIMNGLNEGVIWFKINSDTSTFAHEMGHLFGFSEQYCSKILGATQKNCNGPESINPLSKNLGCDIHATSGPNVCCGEAAGIESPVECLGNKNKFGGRSIMSSANIGSFTEGIIYWDDNELNHIKKVLQCS